MNKVILLLASALIFSFAANSQSKEKVEYFPLIGEKAPSFKAESTLGSVNFPKDYGNNWKVLLSHPADFTPVCTSELLELAQANKEFSDLGVNIVILSTDDIERHKSWVKSMEELTYNGVKNVKFSFPLCEDPKFEASRKYGMIHPNANSTRNVRGVYIIDDKNIIRSIMFYPMETGRNIEEIKRTIVALKKSDSDQVYTPANWNPGSDVIVPFVSNNQQTGSNIANNKDGIYSVSWYFMLKPDSK